ncbi:helix-turn-helix transcriptional regulator [Terasakiella sp.]|uniref:helix-turn-helix transcriptional regulator n=1 Tax=Terasakiella sp. TaxID=2034861 RepID=UPI003AA8C912
MPYIRDKPSSELDTLISRKELAEQLNVHVCTLDRWVRERKGPPRTKFGNKVVYRVSAVNQWLLQHENNIASSEQ